MRQECRLCLNGIREFLPASFGEAYGLCETTQINLAWLPGRPISPGITILSKSFVLADIPLHAQHTQPEFTSGWHMALPCQRCPRGLVAWIPQGQCFPARSVPRSYALCTALVTFSCNSRRPYIKRTLPRKVLWPHLSHSHCTSALF